MRRLRRLFDLPNQINPRKLIDRKKAIGEFLEQAQEISDTLIEERKEIQRNRHNLWKSKNKEKFKESQKKYTLSEKGKEAKKRRQENRKNNFIKSCEGISMEELELCKLFYVDRPEGMEVDHIIPVGKGGKHCLNNLQYLTKEENRKKASKLINVKRKKIHKWQIQQMAKEKCYER
jgi:5-methylcytosine-specific restriction endonuclease McrA